MLGRQLAQFEIIGKLGEGGMSVVYPALDRSLGRTVDVMTFDRRLRLHFSVSPDEKWFAWTQLDSSTYDLVVIKNFR